MVAIAVVTGCGDDDARPSFVEPTPWVRSDRTRLRDDAGRVVVLRGVNARVEGVFDVSFDDGRAPLEEIPAFGADDARRMRELGFGVLRLPINWSGVEPERGRYDDAYVERVAEVVALCAAARIHVLIDFHQDAWSKEIGEDGAPLWAIHPPPTELLGGPLGDTLAARRASMQVLEAFDSFFVDDDDDPEDERLQAAFAAMAAHVALRFADEPWVVGYDLFNEPSTPDHYLVPFHARVTAAIRSVDTRHLIFFEPDVGRQLFERAPLAEAPFPDPSGVYAPHIYTLSFGDPGNELARVDDSRLAPNIEAAAAEARSFEAPLFVGEWGIGPTATRNADYIALTYDLFDRFLAGAAVWLWKERSQGSWGFFDFDGGAWVERDAVRSAHARVYAERIAGEPIAMRYDAASRRFELRYVGLAEPVPHVVYVPAPPDFPAAFEVRCDDAIVTPTPARDPATGRIELLCPGAGEHVVTVVPAG